MSDQSTDDGFAQWWKTLQADPRRPTAVATMSKKTARAGWSAALAQAERAKSAEQQARERAEAGWAEANQRLKDGPDHPPHCDHQMGCHVQETAWMREAADARAALAASEARLAEARENLSVAVEMLGEFVGDRCFRLCDGDGTSRRHTERCQADRYNLEVLEQAQPAARAEEGTR